MLQSFDVKKFSVKEVENMLRTLPKNCSCHICESSINMIKKELGATKYKKICKEIGRFL